VTEQADFGWMRLVLRSLFDDLPRERAIDAIRSSDSLAQVRVVLQTPTPSRPPIEGIPVGEYGDNLLLALLALRTKFTRDEATAKLETNIAMRSARARGSRR
jgi:hypothetical protein